MIGQVFLTVLSGVGVFVIGQIFVKFVIEPIQEFYKLTGQIGHSLIYYANVYSNTEVSPEPELKAAQETFRQHACDLHLRAHTIPLYGLWARIRLLPPRTNANAAGSNLIGLSNGVYDKSAKAGEMNDKSRQRIEALLNLKTGE